MSLDFVDGLSDNPFIEIRRILIPIQNFFRFFQAGVDIIPRAATSVNSVDKTLHHRSFVPLWGKSMIVHDETRVSWFDIPG